MHTNANEGIAMTSGALNADFGLMSAVADRIDTRNEETGAMLRTFIGQMSNVPPSVWGGVAAARFRAVVDRWNTESLALHQSLQRIAETIRLNERTLREAADQHAHRIASADVL
jgi:WXG100 family type VII secretion target